MSKSLTTVPLSRSQDIPFNKLVLSQANVRQVNAGQSLDDLREDIALRGLLQSLNVRPIVDGEDRETGTYEVPAGGRRYRALEQLVKAKRLAKTALIPCVIRSDAADTSLEDDSLAENTHRVALHPLDQYRAFVALRRQNMSEEDIAARYFVSVSVVKQRLRLAAVSPVLLDLYAKDALTLEQLMAFSVTSDHQSQEAVWERLKDGPSYIREAYHIRRQLTESAVAATDRRAVFIGAEAYEAAGGAILRDLFSGDNGGWLQDAVLLDRLVAEKLQILAEGLRSENWKWIEVLPSIPFDHFNDLRKLPSTRTALRPDDQSVLDGLKVEYDGLNEEYAAWEDDLPETVDRRLSELEAAIEALEGSVAESFDPADMGRAGAVVSIDRDGSPLILRGFVRREDEASTPADPVGAEMTGDREGQAERSTPIISLAAAATSPVEAGDDETDILRPLPEKLILELTAFRTIALREAVARNPRVAMTLLLHKLVSDTFGLPRGGSCLQAWVSPPQLFNIAPKDINETDPATAMARRRELWADIVPHDDQALWDWLEAESDAVRTELLAFCISHGVNAVMERPNPNGSTTQHGIDWRLRQAMQIAEATHLDLVASGWRPTADTYLNRVPRPRILEAVREGCGERAAQMIDHLKKADMVVEAERLLADAGWLPEVLRSDEKRRHPVAATGEDALPAFLSDEAEDQEMPATTGVAAE